MMKRSVVLLAASLAFAAQVDAQGGGGRGGRGGGRGGAQVQRSPQAIPQNPEEVPHIRTTPPANAVIQRIWTEGTARSQIMRFGQVLLDSIGSRLTGSPDMERAQAWAVKQYTSWGIPARLERYGTWNSWRKGAAHVSLVAPRVRTLEAELMSWSPGTNGQWIEGEVVVIPASVTSPAEFDAWAAANARGKFVLTSAPRLSCRMPRQWDEFASTESQQAIDSAQGAMAQAYGRRTARGGGRGSPPGTHISVPLKAGGALGVLTTNWSQYPGINKIFGSPQQQLPTLDVGCEDYGLLFRLADNNQKPRVRMSLDAEFLGERPVYNVIAEMKGTQLPNEYVMMSAHFDSWGGSSGATDNGTGSIVMMEAMRILKAVYPQPRRTIIAGLWSGEEQGLNGSRGFAEDHPEIVSGLQVLWNQDNGTGRVVNMGPGPFANTRPVLERWLRELPREISQWIRLGQPSAGPATGGSDHASFQCLKAPGLSLGALSWDYSNTTWHTNRDTYDKVIAEDVRNNAMLVAMLTYLAAEDSQRLPRDLVPMPLDSATNQPRVWPTCSKSTRESAQSNR